MALILEGIYENGRVELTELPKGVNWAKVKVTFLGELSPTLRKPVRKGATSPAHVEVSSRVSNRYPNSLREEYEALIHKKLDRTLTPQEVIRLEAVRAEINNLDRQSAAWQIMENQVAQVENELTALRRELEALPDA